MPPAWDHAIAKDFVHWGWLTVAERERLSAITHAMVQMKHWEGCQGLELDDGMKALIAAQAGLLLLGTRWDHYRNVREILVYPGRYVLPGQGATLQGEIHADRAVLGHASSRGPVVLSWPDVLAGARDAHAGRNLVIHEFAHKLDMLDGLVDGTPPMECSEAMREWVEAMTPVYERLVRDVEAGRQTFLDPYAATNVAEFFAVATEYFFERPEKLGRTHPEVYRALADFYGQDTARRVARHRSARRAERRSRTRRGRRR